MPETTTRWIVDDGQCEESFYAATEEDARDWAEDWIRAGDWEGGGCVISVAVRSADGECRFGVDVVIPADEEQLDEWWSEHCRDNHEHEWERPYSIVGGCRENPGVWSCQNGGVSITEYCQCGARRHTYSASPEVEIDYPHGLWPDGERDDCPSWFRGR